MSPTRPSARRASARGVATLLLAGTLAAGLLAACTPPGEPGVVPSPLLTTPAAEDPVDALPTGPEVVRWGGQDEQLAVVVRNQSPVVVRRAEVVIEARDADGRVLDAVAGNERTTCCTILGLRPDAEFGLFADLDLPVERVADVRVRYADAEPDVEPASGVVRSVVARLVDLQHTDDDTVVRVDVDARSPSSPYLVGQAFLTDPDDRLVAVVSGRFYCLTPGTRRQLRMELEHPTPTSTRVDRVVVHPVPAGVAPGVTHDCP